MSCDGHMAHVFEQDDPECTHCGHPRSEHPDDFWTENRGNPELALTSSEDQDRS